MPKSASYKPYKRFDDPPIDCPALSDDLLDWEGDCWGEVQITESYPGSYTYACEGHMDMFDGLPYVPEPKKPL